MFHPQLLRPGRAQELAHSCHSRAQLHHRQATPASQVKRAMGTPVDQVKQVICASYIKWDTLASQVEWVWQVSISTQLSRSCYSLAQNADIAYHRMTITYYTQ